MHQLRADRTLSMSAHVLSKAKRNEKIQKRNKGMTKKLITKINRNSKDVENEEKLCVLHLKLIY